MEVISVDGVHVDGNSKTNVFVSLSLYIYIYTYVRGFVTNSKYMLFSFFKSKYVLFSDED